MEQIIQSLGTFHKSKPPSPKKYNMLMQKLSRSLYKIPVIALHHGGVIAIANEPIIDPHNLKIIGWRCKENGIDSILLSEEVRGIAADSLTVNSDTALSQPEDLVRQKETLELKFQLIGKPVKTKHAKVGKVTDFTYDDQAMMIQQLYVEPPLTRIFGSHDTRIIGRSQIKTITDTYILVNDAETEIKKPATQLAEESEVPLAEAA